MIKIIATYPEQLSGKRVTAKYPNINVLDLSHINDMPKVAGINNRPILSAEQIISQIKAINYQVDYVLVKADTDMIKALDKQPIPYIIIYPKDKQEYLNTLMRSNYPAYYMDYIQQHFDEFIKAIRQHPHTVAFSFTTDADNLFETANKKKEDIVYA